MLQIPSASGHGDDASDNEENCEDAEDQDVEHGPLDHGPISAARSREVVFSNARTLRAPTLA